jgi:hypothetical protein
MELDCAGDVGRVRKQKIDSSFKMFASYHGRPRIILKLIMVE